MNPKSIQSVLQDALEDTIPASKIHLWPAVKANLVAGKFQAHQQGEKMITTRTQRMPKLALAIIIILALFVILLVTPQGRSFAQSILQLFTRAESTAFPLEDSQIAASAPDPSAPTAMPPSPLISVAEAEAQVGFSAAELPYIPDGFEYLGARLYGKNINIEYETRDKGGHLIIQQSQEGFYQSGWDQVPADAVAQVKIGEVDGEFVQGTFVRYPGETSATWNPDAAILRLRWEKDGVWFEITKYGNAEAIRYLDHSGMIEIAESLIYKP